MMARRRAADPVSRFGLIMFITMVFAGMCWYWSFLPGAFIVWIGLLTAAWMEPPVVLTGPKDSTGQLTPDGNGQTKKLRRYRRLSELKTTLFMPGKAALPEKPFYASFLGGIVAAVASGLAPLDGDSVMHWVGKGLATLSAFVVVVAVAAACRSYAKQGLRSPGVRLDTFPEVPQTTTMVGAVAGAVAAIAGFFTLFDSMWLVPRAGISICAGIAVFAAIIVKHWRTAALGHWRLVEEGRAEWAAIWPSVTKAPPTILDREMIGEATVDTFDAPAGVGSAGFLTKRIELMTAMDTGMEIGLLTLPTKDVAGQDVPGTVHPSRFQVVRWPSDQVPAVMASTDPETVGLVVRAALQSALGDNGIPAPAMTGLELLTEPGESAEHVWAFRGTPQGGFDWAGIRAERASIAEALECDVLIDSNSDSGIYFGALDAEDLVWMDDDPTAFFDRIRLEDEWDRRWGEALKSTVNPPNLQHETTAEATLVTGQVIHRQAFIAKQGLPTSDYFGVEAKLATTMQAVPYIGITAFPDYRTGRAGDRFPGGLVAYWSDHAVPAAISDLVPGRYKADLDPNIWVIAGKINDAFSNARLSRPEVIWTDCKALTKKQAAQHIWEIPLRLHDGNTLANVIGQTVKLREALGVAWLRVGPGVDEFGCTIYAGTTLTEAELAHPHADALRLESLDWAQFFTDSRVTKGTGGLQPRLTAVETMPHNQLVKVLTFDLPAGLSAEDICGGLSKLKTASGYGFIEVRQDPDTPKSMTLLVAETDPMPRKFAFDFDFVTLDGSNPFATGLDGTPIGIDFALEPHLLLSGTSGAGKTASAQCLMYAVLASRADVAVLDIQKFGADFQFAKDRAIAFATTALDAAATMRALYAEVKRRAQLNAEYGAASARDLPDGVRPKPIVVFMDEFLGMIMAGTRPPKTAEENPERERQRIENLAIWEAKKDIAYCAGRIAAEARSADVHLVLMTQRLLASALDQDLKEIKTNLARILLGKANPDERKTALRDPSNAPDPGAVVPRGRGVWESTIVGAELCQFWFATAAEYREQLVKRIPPIDSSRLLDLTPYLAAPVFPTSGPTPDPDTEEEIVEIAPLSFSLDDLEAFEDDESDDDGEIPPWLAALQTKEADDDDDSWPEADSDEDSDMDSEVVDDEERDMDSDTDAEMDDTLVIATGFYPPEDLDGYPEGEYGWGRITALTELLDGQPDIRRVAWIDEELDDEDDIGLTHGEVAAEMLDARGIEHLLLADANEDQLDVWLNGYDVESDVESDEEDVEESGTADGMTTEVMVTPVVTMKKPAAKVAAVSDASDPFTAPLPERKLVANPFDEPVRTMATVPDPWA